jgi:hypothetical protein
MSRANIRNELFTKEEMCSAFSRLIDIHHRMVSTTLQSTDVYLHSLLVCFCHQETKTFRIDILAKISHIWNIRIIARCMHGIANWTRKALRPFSQQELKAESNKPISSGGEMRSSNKWTELNTSGGVVKHPIYIKRG